MAQVRLMRVETHPKLILIEKRLESFSNLLNDPAQGETLDNLIKTLYEKIETAVTEGCSGSGYSWLRKMTIRGGAGGKPINIITFHSKMHLRLKWAKLSLIMNKIEQGGSVT